MPSAVPWPAPRPMGSCRRAGSDVERRREVQRGAFGGQRDIELGQPAAQEVRNALSATAVELEADQPVRGEGAGGHLAAVRRQVNEPAPARRSLGCDVEKAEPVEHDHVPARRTAAVTRKIRLMMSSFRPRGTRGGADVLTHVGADSPFPRPIGCARPETRADGSAGKALLEPPSSRPTECAMAVRAWVTCWDGKDSVRTPGPTRA